MNNTDSGGETATAAVAPAKGATAATAFPIDAAVTTSRLSIEPLRSIHAPLLLPALADERMYAYIPDNPRPTHESLAKRYAILERGAPAGTTDVWLNWALQCLGTAEYIGTLQATVTPGKHAYVGYILRPSAWGRGFASEACRWLIAALRTHYVLDEILAMVDVRNHRSVRMLERIGFQCLGTEPSELHGEATTDFRFSLPGAASR